MLGYARGFSMGFTLLLFSGTDNPDDQIERNGYSKSFSCKLSYLLTSARLQCYK